MLFVIGERNIDINESVVAAYKTESAFVKDMIKQHKHINLSENEENVTSFFKKVYAELKK